jgi:hypothetical protein
MRTSRKATLAVAALFALAALFASLASAEVEEKQGIRVAVEGKLAPRTLPRRGTAPVAVSLSGKIGARGSVSPPQLETLTISINRQGKLSSRGIPNCRLGHIDPSTTQEALAACRSSLVGEGSFSADVRLPEQSPFPSQGKVLAFNGKIGGRPAIFAHIYGTKPVPTSYVLPFLIKSSAGTYGTILEASLPKVTGEWGFVTGISITLDRQGFLSAGCPAPKGFGTAVFPLMRTSFGFQGGLELNSTLTRSCKAKG